MNGTIDREQQQGRQTGETSDAGAGRDLGWILAFAAVFTLLLFTTGALGALTDWASGLPERDRIGLIGALLLFPIGAGIYAALRYRDAKDTRATLYRLAYHDALTGLANRRFLGDGFDQMLKYTRRHNGRIAVLFVDLDGVEEINHSYGQALGDQTIAAVAARLVEVAGPDDRAVRYGGDQFVLFCPDVSTATSAERIAKAILSALQAPFELDGGTITVSAYIGIAITEERCTRPDEVLHDADAALNQAKQDSPTRVVLYDRAMRDRVTPSTAERRLRAALEKGELRLYYQPIVSLWTKRLVGVEALLRWNEPVRGLVSPEEFMSALEDTGLILPIGRWVIDEVARQAKAWHDAYPDRPTLSIKVNVSERQLGQANFVSQLRDTLARFGTDPSGLYLEIAEGVLRHEPDAITATLTEAHGLGVKLALDHFGTGYSSLSHLRRLGLDMLTVDRSFVAGLGHSEEDATIVTHVIGMAKALGMVTVAEGVEEDVQVQRLRDLSCDLAQGYLFSHPQPPYVITELLGRATGQEWQPPSRPADDLAAPVVVLDRFDAASR